MRLRMTSSSPDLLTAKVSTSLRKPIGAEVALEQRRHTAANTRLLPRHGKKRRISQRGPRERNLACHANLLL